MKSSSENVLLGFSGGVDSTAAAFLLQKAGYDVTAFYFDVMEGDTEEKARAARIANDLGLKFVYKNANDAFNKKIIAYFCRSYENGETPTPCVFCNPLIKFRLLRDTADRLGIEKIATGHYARLKQDEFGLFYPATAACRQKDQSYMLYRLPQEILRDLLLPLGSMPSKEEVRALAREELAANADARDSQEICFIKDKNYVDFLLRKGCRNIKGRFVDENGEKLGDHLGLLHYTVGQRKGLGMSFGKPMFVSGIDGTTGDVTLTDNASLFKSHVWVRDLYLCGAPYTDKVKREQNEDHSADSSITDPCLSASIIYRDPLQLSDLTGKIRYGAKPAQCAIAALSEDGSSALIRFAEPQRAPAPGQALVLYRGDRVIGGGIITTLK